MSGVARRGHADLSAARPQLGLSHAGAVDHGGRPAVLLDRFRPRAGARAHPARARHLHPDRAGVDHHDAERARSRPARPLAACASW